MKELVLNKCKNIDGKYFGVITFGYFRYLLESNIINLNAITSTYNTPENIAASYNENTDTSEIIGFQIDLIAIKNESCALSLNNEDLVIKSESLDILDGAIRAKIILNLQDRFMDNLLYVKLHIVNSVYETHDLMRDLFAQVKIKRNETAK